jgi:DNA-binding response OmpR family regulator
MKKLILLIDDDPAVQTWLQEALPEKLFLLEIAQTGRDGLDMALRRKPDIVLLDWNLPGWDGLELCKQLKQNKASAHIPLIMLTGYTQVQRKIAAFNAGADDYLSKPFEMEELVARIKAVLRRHMPAADDIVRMDGISLNLTAYSAEVDKKPLQLTSTEFSLLHMLMKNPGHILTRKYLLEHIWGYADDVSTRTVDVYIRRLRKKLGIKRAASIQSVHGMGYKYKNKKGAPLQAFGASSLEMTKSTLHHFHESTRPILA